MLADSLISHGSKAVLPEPALVGSPSDGWGADPTQAAQAAYGGIAQVLQEQGLTIIHERLFGSLSVKPAVLAARAAALRARGISPDEPLTYIQGHPTWGDGLAGVIIRAVSSILASPSVRAELKN